MTACVANYWLSIIVAVVFTLLVGLRHYFLGASRSIQRLEALGSYIRSYICEYIAFSVDFYTCTARSPVYSHISATIQGLSTIRAYKEQIRFLNNFHFYQNEHTKGWYTKLTTTRWFGIRLDMFGAVFITSLVFTSIPLSDGNIVITKKFCAIAVLCVF